MPIAATTETRRLRVLVAGHDGYIGPILVDVLRQAGHEVTGLDSSFYSACHLGAPPAPIPSIRADIRDIHPDQLVEFDAVACLAALSNDPLGNLDPDLTFAINHAGTLALARAAKAAGVARFLFSSSCSLYGVAGDDFLDETAPFNPATPYGETKILSEEDLHDLAADDFSPVYLRNATAYGVSPRLRGDLVVNNLVAYALTTGKVLIKSDGTPWRPLVHVQDIALAFLCALEAPREVVHDIAFNVGVTSENYRVHEIADMVAEAVPGSEITYADDAGPDPRCYRVSCEKIATELPGWHPQWTVQRGIEELVTTYRRFGLTLQMLESDALMRIRRIETLLETRRLGRDLRWIEEPSPPLSPTGTSRSEGERGSL